jgi:hypothetical protein
MVRARQLYVCTNDSVSGEDTLLVAQENRPAQSITFYVSFFFKSNRYIFLLWLNFLSKNEKEKFMLSSFISVSVFADPSYTKL